MEQWVHSVIPAERPRSQLDSGSGCQRGGGRLRGPMCRHRALSRIATLMNGALHRGPSEHRDRQLPSPSIDLMHPQRSETWLPPVGVVGLREPLMLDSAQRRAQEFRLQHAQSPRSWQGHDRLVEPGVSAARSDYAQGGVRQVSA